MKVILYILGTKPILFLLLGVNVVGTLYGYIWYTPQLSETPARFFIFVPDSPTASLFFLIVLIGFLFKKNLPLIEALAIVTLMKYGIWAVIMNLLVLFATGNLHWTGYMLIASHFAMAIQGVLYAPYYRFKLWHLMVAAIWTIHNDMIDYLFGMMPDYSMLNANMPQIGYFTFWLSVMCLFTAYVLVLAPKSAKLKLS
jgi:uncharacterized membrane protein YpjA